ncbi:MAG: hypothetical protein EB010_09300, partial [Acidimicrobiia bacterium]|nr:hypothetical protein [Acidimicrobiia bacterium]
MHPSCHESQVLDPLVRANIVDGGQTRSMENPTDHFPVKNGRVVRVSSGNGHSLRTIQRGERRTDSPVFLLIHGLASNARMWDG